MERVIKFRLYDKGSSRFLYAAWGDIHDNDVNTGREYYPLEFCVGFKGNHASELSSPMQFSGLTDKKCKDVYEGDIVRKNTGTATPYSIVHEGKNLTAYEPIYKNYFVVFYRGAFCIHDKPDTKEHETSTYNGTSYAGTLQSAGYDIEIIGNIHENPELLK